MFQFPGFAFVPYVFRHKYLLLISVSPKPCSFVPEAEGFGITDIEGGFPHSEIRGSKVVRTSPRLIAAYHVLHRLLAPRHPPDTLITLNHSHYRYPPLVVPRQRATRSLKGLQQDHDRKDQFCFKHIRERCGQATPTCRLLEPAAGMLTPQVHLSRLLSISFPCG